MVNERIFFAEPYFSDKSLSLRKEAFREAFPSETVLRSDTSVAL